MKLDMAQAIRTLLVGDAVLQSLYPGGQVDLYYRMAPPDAQMPYQTFALRMTEEDIICLNEGSLAVDTWDFGPDDTRGLAIAQRTRELLHYRGLPTPGRTHLVKFWIKSDLDIPTDAQDVWRNSQIFAARAFDQRTADAMLERDGGS